MSEGTASAPIKSPVASIVMTVRCGDLARKNNLIYVFKLLNEIQGVEIVIVEQDIRPALSQSELPANCTCKFVFNDNSFNKSWGLNIAVSMAQSEVLISYDADMIVDTHSLQQAISDVSGIYDLVKPYATLIDLNASETDYLISGGTELNISRRESQINRRNKGQRPPLCGGVFVISKALFLNAGGMDERFSGWGGEDDALSQRVLNQNPRVKVNLNSVAYHLWHKAAAGKSETAKYIRNFALLSAYVEMGDSLVNGFRDDGLGNADKRKYQNNSATSFISSLPLISCLCVTYGRAEKLQRAIACFEQQTYVNRELIIICESDDLTTLEYLKTIDNPLIHFHSLESADKKTLGELRNVAIEKANGAYFCQWDDDDYYDPKRLSKQLNHCLEHNKAASVLPRWTIYSEQHRQAYISNVRLWEGSILCRKDVFETEKVYLPQSQGEEVNLIKQLLIKDEIAIVDSPELYIYCHTGANTWSDKHFARLIKFSSKLNSNQTRRVEERLGSHNTEPLNRVIPKILHQTHYSHKQELPKELKKLQNLLIDTHPDWQHEHYRDQDCRQFIHDHMPELTGVYDYLPLPVQKADLFRLVVVYVQGGFYVDMDIEIKRPLDALCQQPCVFAQEVVLDEKTRIQLSHKHAVRIANYMFGAAPGDQFIGDLIQKVVGNHRQRVSNENDILNSTGPGMLTRAFHQYRHKNKITLLENNGQYCEKCQQNSCHFGDYAVHHHQGSWRWQPLQNHSRKIHQTWKTASVPGQFEDYCHGWRNLHPNWSYQLWTDDDNRQLIKEEFPEFLETYDNYPYAIQRVDAARLFILYKFGGLYVDIDYQCLKPIESLLEPHELVFGLEHPRHSRYHNVDKIIGNAFIFAKHPEHTFIKNVIENLPRYAQRKVLDKNSLVLNTTGPLMLTEVYDQYKNKNQIKLLPHDYLYPLESTEASQTMIGESGELENGLLNSAYAIHFHAGSWWK